MYIGATRGEFSLLSSFKINLKYKTFAHVAFIIYLCIVHLLNTFTDSSETGIKINVGALMTTRSTMIYEQR